MRRITLGLALIVHGLAHSAAGTWSSAHAPVALATVLWWFALVGFVAAGLGVLRRVPVLHRRAPMLATTAAGASMILVLLAPHPLYLIGAIVDVALVVATRRWRPEVARGGTAAIVTSTVILVYLSAVILLRPWHTRWGTTAAERAMSLPGDELVPVAHYRMDHAITIDAPPDSVWPWLVQIGQDRGGFYSYAWLERLVGADIHNADRIHPEWQTRAAGDLVRATQRDYLGGLFGSEPGWRVARLDPGRAMVLEQWGAFVVHSAHDGRTRLHVRLRGDGRPGWAALVGAPAGLVVFEPAHFIMERGMLRGIKRRAERMMHRDAQDTKTASARPTP